MNTKNLIDQLNTLIDKATPDALEIAFYNVDVRLIDYKGRRKDAKEILTKLVEELSSARFEIGKHDLTAHQTEAAMFNIMKSISTVDERTTNPDVIDYAEHLAREIMLATKINIDDV